MATHLVEVDPNYNIIWGKASLMAIYSGDSCLITLTALFLGETELYQHMQQQLHFALKHTIKSWNGQGKESSVEIVYLSTKWLTFGQYPLNCFSLPIELMKHHTIGK